MPGLFRRQDLTFRHATSRYCLEKLIAFSQNDALFSLPGVIYGGNGQTSFFRPDLQSGVPLSYGNGAGLPRYIIGRKNRNTITDISNIEYAIL
ncbi:tail fiber protein [Thalassospira sp. MCCC 1A01428]|uniref:tail fiber protein n=1 Tax=Thalassospira sp. MCCC 1A01428 TaxID=1470575 RepID=UPI000A1F5BC8